MVVEDRTINDARLFERGRDAAEWLRFGWITNAIHEAGLDCKAMDRPEIDRQGDPNAASTDSRFYPGHNERLVNLALKHQRSVLKGLVEYQDVICAIRNGKRTRRKIVDYIVSHGLGRGRVVNDFSGLAKLLADLEAVHWIKLELTANGYRYFLTAEGHLVHKFGIVM